MNMFESIFGPRRPPPAKNALESFDCRVIGTANGAIIQFDNRNFVVQLTGDSPSEFKAVADAVLHAYEAHLRAFEENAKKALEKVESKQ